MPENLGKIQQSSHQQRSVRRPDTFTLIWMVNTKINDTPEAKTHIQYLGLDSWTSEHRCSSGLMNNGFKHPTTSTNGSIRVQHNIGFVV